MSPTARPQAPTWLPPFAEEEFDAVSNVFCLRIQEGSMPPDDAYWWTRVLVADAVCTLMQGESPAADSAAGSTRAVASCPAPS